MAVKDPGGRHRQMPEKKDENFDLLADHRGRSASDEEEEEEEQGR